MNDLDRLLQTMIDKGASDLHLNHNARISYRINGKIVQDGPKIRGDQVFALALFALTSEQQRQFHETKSLDFSYSLGETRFRGSLIHQRGKPSCVFRKINSKIIPIDQLGLPDVVKKMAMMSWGMILVTGPTGSGKSTTMAGIVDYINENKEVHITTIEEPIEYVHQNKKAIVTQREVGKDSLSFAESMKTVLRQDPDVIVVGEMRDIETITAALTNAQTGHLVLGTLHSNSAPQTIQRIVDIFPPEQARIIRAQLASNLRMVINQRLVTKEDGNRKALYEIMVLNDEMRKLIREGRDELLYDAMRRAPEIGNVIMNFD